MLEEWIIVRVFLHSLYSTPTSCNRELPGDRTKVTMPLRSRRNMNEWERRETGGGGGGVLGDGTFNEETEKIFGYDGSQAVPTRTSDKLNNIKTFSSYLGENTRHHHHNDELVNAVQGNNPFTLRITRNIKIHPVGETRNYLILTKAVYIVTTGFQLNIPALYFRNHWFSSRPRIRLKCLRCFMCSSSYILKQAMKGFSIGVPNSSYEPVQSKMHR
jgi:hypothetical protein